MPTDPCGALPPPPPVFYRRWGGRPDSEIDAPFFHLHLRENRSWSCGKVYKHPKDYPGEYVARKFVITEDFYGPSNESISSRSLRDVRNVLRSLYRGLIQLKRLPDDEPYFVEVWL